jgi:hypothetical protein
MPIRIPTGLLVLTLLALGAGVPGSSAGAEEGAGASADRDVAASPPIYQLPKVGKPTGRVGGGRRGTGDALPGLYALVPDHVGYTTSRQPVLYWYLSERVGGDVHLELTLIDEKSVDPLLDRQFPAPAQPGLQAIRLADYGVSLEPGQEYQWSVSLVPDAADHSKDVVSSGWIEVVTAPDDLAAQLAAAGDDGAPQVYGAAGLWYDTLAASAARLERDPANPRYRSDLDRLLAEVGLPESVSRP